MQENRVRSQWKSTGTALPVAYWSICERTAAGLRYAQSQGVELGNPWIDMGAGEREAET